LESRDVNGDGELNVDGFKAALLQKEFKLTGLELEETFYLNCQWNGLLRYHDWLRTISDDLAKYFTKNQKAPEVEKSDSNRHPVIHKDKDPVKVHHDAGLAERARIKFENFIRQEDLSLGSVFALINANSDSVVTKAEFRNKIHVMQMNLDEDEITALFKSIDLNNSATVTYDELIEAFKTLNIQQILKKLKNYSKSGSSTLQFLFKRFAHNDRLSQLDFTKMCKEFINKITEPEIV
jgi:Ca2+-binding EF-hand superfamily protein